MQIVRILRKVQSFLIGEEGLATLEWVAIAAAVILLGVGVIIILQPRVNTAASDVGSKLVSSVNTNS